MRASLPFMASPTKTTAQSVPYFNNYGKSKLNPKRVSEFVPHSVNFQVTKCWRGHASYVAAATHSSLDSNALQDTSEVIIEKAIYQCRFLAFLAVLGSLIGSFLCFIKLHTVATLKLFALLQIVFALNNRGGQQGCMYVVASFMEYLVNRGKVITLLIEAIDVYLLGTVMLVFGMGLYELFISNLDTAKSSSEEKVPHSSNLFGLFALKERPRWLEIKTVSELKTKLGHVIVMLLLIGIFDKSKRAIIHTPTDLLCFSASILLSSGSLFLLAKLNDQK